MKYSADAYATAFWAVYTAHGAKQDAKLIERLTHLLRRTGDIHSADSIVRAIERRAAGAQGGRNVVVEFARQPTPIQLTALRAVMQSHDIIEVRTRPALVAGMRVSINGEYEYDGSLQRKLEKLFG